MSAQAADCFIVDYADGNGTLYYRYAASDYTSAGYANSSGKLLGKWFDCAWSNIVWHGDYKILDLSNNGYTGKFATNKQVFKLFGGRTYGKVRFGAVKMYDGETLVRDYIPAKLGGVAGMWDRKERKFYRCAQNGTLFEEGPVVASEPGDFAVTHSVTADEGGTATISDPEAELGTSVTLTATPAAGYAFAGWMGNIPAAYAASATATFVVTEPLVVQAAFAADVPYVVDPSGGGDFTTLDEAVAALAGKAGTLQVKAGVYTVTNTLALTGGLAMVPESGRLGDVTVAAGATDKFTLVELSHPLARLSNLVISNGYTQSSQKGGNVTMSAGIVENCLITAGRMRGDSGTVPAAAGVYMTGGALRNSLVRGNYTVGDNGCALGVYAKGVDTLVENCDVSCNTNLMNYRVEYLVRSGGIRVDGGLVRNCTITNNVNIGHSNLYVTDGGRVEDTLVADNVGGFYFDELSGGGYVPKGGSATFVRTTFARNSGYGIGGLYVGGSVTLTGVRAYGNTSVVGGNDGNMDVRGCSTAGIDFTDPGETPVERVADVHVPADTTDIREAVRRCADGGTVHVAAGEHLISHEVVVDRPIRIVGAGAELTTLTRDPSVPYLRLVNLRHADAAVEGLAVTGGRKLGVNCVNVFKGTLRQALVADASDEGACAVWNGGAIRDTRFTRIASSCTYSGLGAAVSVKSGAVMEDCVVEKCRQQGDNLVNVFGGRLARLTFRDNYVAGNPAACIGLNGPGVVESTLVTHNDGSWYSAAGFIVGGTGWEVRNCTVVSNLSEYAGAAVHWITNAWNNTVRQGTFVNCIFYRNHCTKDKHPEFFDVSSGNGTRNIDVTFRNCLFTTSEAAAAQGERAIDSLSGDPLFRSLARRDYRLGAGSPCRAAGYLWRGAEEPSATDIAGRPLSRAGCIDVGCHATSHGGLMMIVR